MLPRDTPPRLLPLLFAISQPPVYQHHLTHTLAFPSVPQETGFRRIHSPHRVLREVGGLALVPNSTTPPVRTGASSVLMGFDVRTQDGRLWSARMISNGRSECDLFLMDSATLQRKAMAKLRVVPCGAGHSVDARLTLFDATMLIHSAGVLLVPWVATIRSLVQGPCSKLVSLDRQDLGLHRRYRRMVVTGR
jgi:hypothetical protein